MPSTAGTGLRSRVSSADTAETAQLALLQLKIRKADRSQLFLSAASPKESLLSFALAIRARVLTSYLLAFLSPFSLAGLPQLAVNSELHTKGDEG